jgi:glucose/mannose transport system permease protein
MFKLLRSDRSISILVLSPSIIAVAFFTYFFIIWTIYVSFTDWNSPVINYSFAGLKNWRRLFGDYRFHTNLLNLVIFSVGYMTQCIVGGFVIAALLDQKIKAEWFFRTIVLLPFAVSEITTGVAWRWLMKSKAGINDLFAYMGFENFHPLWYSDPDYGMWALTIAASWQFTGYVMALYLAGMRAIPQELREAAFIDGAGTLALYKNLYIPLLWPVTFTAIMLTGMRAIKSFDLISVIGEGPGFVTDMLGNYMFEQTFRASRYGLGATIATVMLLLSVFLLVPYIVSVQLEEKEK